MILALNFKNNLVNSHFYIKNLVNSKLNVILLPSFLQLEAFNKKSNFNLGVQNVQSTLTTVTGEISAPMLKKYNINYCLVGHSERRISLNESNEILNQKIKCLLDNNITPILCVGENDILLEEKTIEFIKNQLSSNIILSNQSKIIVAYEPVFAIGSNKPCDINHLNKVINFIKSNYNFKVVLYGGSINENNISDFVRLDGVLVGRASLDVNKVNKMIKVLENV